MIDRILKLSQSEVEALAPLLYEKDYSSSIVTFIDNPARTLSYWGEEPNILPHGDEGGKRRKYSFFDLVWLLLIRELRDFGFQKPALARVKAKLLATEKPHVLASQIKENRALMEKLFKEHFNMDSGEVEQLIQELAKKGEPILHAKQTTLSANLHFALLNHRVFKLVFTKGGDCQLLYEDMQGLGELEEGASLPPSYVVINMTSLITNLLTLPIIKDPIKQAVFTGKEWQVIQHLRKPNVIEAVIHYKKGKPERMELIKEKRVQAEARISEVMIKGAFGKIELNYEDGQVLYFLETEKIKIK